MVKNFKSDTNESFRVPVKVNNQNQTYHNLYRRNIWRDIDFP